MPTGAITQEPSIKEKTWNAINVTGAVGAIKGNVYDKETKEPIEGVVVSFQTYSDYTDLEGYYEITEIPAGTHTFTFTKGGYYIAERDAVINEGEWTILDVELTPGEGPEPSGFPWLWLGLGAAAAVGIAAIAKSQKPS
jgi:hypothetical protein